MTITYTAQVATARSFGCFLKLLFRWKGSIYKLVWMDLLLFLTIYYTINFVYYYGLNDARKATFEILVYYCNSYGSLIPLSFVLGFYVNLVMQRWWDQYMYIPWPDSLAVYVSAHVQGHDEGARVMRRTIMRYVCACCTMVLSMISPAVKKRFPTLQHLVDAGLLQESEKNVIVTIDNAFPQYPKHWMPIIWATSIVTRARKEGRIRDDYAVKTIIDALNDIRASCGVLLYYDFISVPLVYTQVVTIAVYSYFMCSLLAHQWTVHKQGTYEELDFYIPLFMALQFFFYMGWLKVAETLINPFGDDDDDFEVNWMIDRHLQVSYMIVDEMHHEHPELVRDQYWDEILPNELPYDTYAKREKPPEHSTAKYDKQFATNTHENVPKRTSIFSTRSEQFNQAFQRFGIASDEAFPSKPKQSSTASGTSYTETLRGLTSYISETFSKQEFDEESHVYESVPEELHEQQPNEEDEFEKLIESRSKSSLQIFTAVSSSSDSDLFDRLRAQRQQKRLKRMNDYLVQQFGPNYRLVYTEPVPEEDLLMQDYESSHKVEQRSSEPSAKVTEKPEDETPRFRLVPQLGLMSSERIQTAMVSAATSPLSTSTSSASLPEKQK